MGALSGMSGMSGLSAMMGGGSGPPLASVSVFEVTAADFTFDTAYPPTGYVYLALYDSTQSTNIQSILFSGGNPGQDLGGGWKGSGGSNLVPGMGYNIRIEESDSGGTPTGHVGPWTAFTSQEISAPSPSMVLSTDPSLDPTGSSGNTDGGPLNFNIILGATTIYNGEPSGVITGLFNGLTGLLIFNATNYGPGEGTYGVTFFVNDWAGNTVPWSGSPNSFVVTDNGDGTFSLSIQ